VDTKRTFDRRGARAGAQSSPSCSFNSLLSPQKAPKFTHTTTRCRDLQCGLSPFAPAAAAAQPFVEIQAHAAAPGANRRAHRHSQERLFGGANAQQRFYTPRTDRDLDSVGA